MAHAAVTERAEKYGPRHFMIRARLYSGLNKQVMNVGPLVHDERLKIVLPQACCYCGNRQTLSADHLIPTKRGGANAEDNIVWACRACNTAKGARDVLEWLGARGPFPPILLLRRRLKLAIGISREKDLMQTPVSAAPAVPFSLPAIPMRYPPPRELRMWIVPLEESAGAERPAMPG